ncbi:MAG: hypothetical protein H6973_13225 [Gammaproteobacteria bacterium]|nr:hypothetical protein [Gammaproteobacteria bacterium]
MNKTALLTEYRFTTRDGFSIVTYHCAKHGDVIPSLQQRRVRSVNN